MKQKLTEQEKEEKLRAEIEEGKMKYLWNSFLYTMSKKGALISYTIPNDKYKFKTTNNQQPAAGTN